MISEGIGDLIAAFMAGINRNFTWKSYLSQKALSLTIALATGGFGGFKKSLELAQKNLGNIGTIIKSTISNCTGGNMIKLAWNSTG